MKKVSFFTNIAPHYREALWVEILKEESIESDFYFGEGEPIGIKSMNLQGYGVTDKLHKLKNIWLFNRILIFQLGVLNVCIKKNIDVAIFLGEANCISTWIASIVCRMRGIEVIFWGHGLYGKENVFLLNLRILFYSLANKQLVYGELGKKRFVDHGFLEHKIFTFYNSLDYKKQVSYRRKNSKISKDIISNYFKNNADPLLIFVGRLTKVKELHLLLEAVKKLNARSFGVNLLMIGDGKDKNHLEKIGSALLVEGRLKFTGACYEESTLARYISTADLFVSPGNIGLSAIHSLTYGTPVCTHNNWTEQMPEAEAIKENYNGCFFTQGNVESLAMTIKRWLEKDIPRNIIQQRCYEVVDTKYNPSTQLAILKRAIE